ncbi:MAG: thioredoxin family protein [Ignavibacteriales bacterium]|nr:MAG: thioredoxin family protein [Ignavibacteriales bacterium]
MKFLLPVLFILLSSLSVAQQTDSLESKRVKFDPSKNPESDLKNAVVMAEGTNKRIILDVGGEWCIWCHRLDKFFEENADIKNFMEENFVVVKVNYSPENKNEKFLSNYPKIPGYPHLFVLDKDGKFLHSQDTGKLESGKGYSKDSVINFLHTWAMEKVDSTKN